MLNDILRERKSKAVQFEENRKQRKKSQSGETLQEILESTAIEEAQSLAAEIAANQNNVTMTETNETSELEGAPTNAQTSPTPESTPEL